MALSRLQRFIMTEIFGSRLQRFSRQRLTSFYEKQRHQPKDIENVITKSVERLIDHEYLVGYGRRTPHKWFIDELRLTAKGRRTARSLLGEQQRLPLGQPRSRLSRRPL